MNRQQIIAALRAVSVEISKQQLIEWFNEKDINYTCMTDIEMYVAYYEKTQAEPQFMVVDRSGRGGTYNTNESELIASHDDDENLADWCGSAEVGAEYTEYNNKKIIRIS